MEYTSKISIETAVINEIERKYHQTEGGSQLLQEYFISDLGNFGE